MLHIQSMTGSVRERFVNEQIKARNQALEERIDLESVRKWSWSFAKREERLRNVIEAVKHLGVSSGGQ